MPKSDALHPFDQRYLALGKACDKMIAYASIERCNCMVRNGDGPQMPAIKHGKQFFTPEGKEIVKPTSYEMMHHNDIARLMKQRDEVYIGHLFP